MTAPAQPASHHLRSVFDRRAIRFWLLRVLNALQGCGFSWGYLDDGIPHKTIIPWRGTCPYPLRNDWSARACIKAGDCGCDERERNHD